jgi:hypothetical protein
MKHKAQIIYYSMHDNIYTVRNRSLQNICIYNKRRARPMRDSNTKKKKKKEFKNVHIKLQSPVLSFFILLVLVLKKSSHSNQLSVTC